MKKFKEDIPMNATWSTSPLVDMKTNASLKNALLKISSDAATGATPDPSSVDALKLYLNNSKNFFQQLFAGGFFAKIKEFLGSLFEKAGKILAPIFKVIGAGLQKLMAFFVRLKNSQYVQSTMKTLNTTQIMGFPIMLWIQAGLVAAFLITILVKLYNRFSSREDIDKCAQSIENDLSVLREEEEPGMITNITKKAGEATKKFIDSEKYKNTGFLSKVLGSLILVFAAFLVFIKFKGGGAAVAMNPLSLPADGG